MTYISAIKNGNKSYNIKDKVIRDSLSVAYINVDSLADIQLTQNGLSTEAYSIRIAKSKNQNHPTNGDSVIHLTTDLVQALTFRTETGGLEDLFVNGEAYYKVLGQYYSQNIKNLIKLPKFSPKDIQSGDTIVLHKRIIDANTFFDDYIDFSGISVSDSAFQTYKATRGFVGKTDGEFIKYLIVNGEIFGCVDNTNYKKLADNKKVVVYSADIDNTNGMPTLDVNVERHPDQLLNNGVYAYIAINEVLDAGRYDVYVTRSSTPDGSGYYSIQQIFIGRAGASAGKGYMRMVFARNNDTEKIFGSLVKIGGNGDFTYPTNGVSTGINLERMNSSGVYAYEWISGRNDILEGRYDIYIERSTTPDSSGYYAIKQTLISRDVQRAYMRSIFTNGGLIKTSPFVLMGDDGDSGFDIINILDYAGTDIPMPVDADLYIAREEGMTYPSHYRIYLDDYHDEIYFIVCLYHTSEGNVYCVFELNEQGSGWIYSFVCGGDDVPDWILEAFGEDGKKKEEVVSAALVDLNERVENLEADPVIVARYEENGSLILDTSIIETGDGTNEGAYTTLSPIKEILYKNEPEGEFQKASITAREVPGLIIYNTDIPASISGDRYNINIEFGTIDSGGVPKHMLMLDANAGSYYIVIKIVLNNNRIINILNG